MIFGFVYIAHYFLLFSISQYFNFIEILFWYYFSVIECLNILKVIRGQGWHQLLPEIYSCSSASPFGREFSLLPFRNLFSALESNHHLSIYSWTSWISGWKVKVHNLYFSPTIRLKEILLGSSDPQLMLFLWLLPPCWAFCKQKVCKAISEATYTINTGHFVALRVHWRSPS